MKARDKRLSRRALPADPKRRAFLGVAAVAAAGGKATAKPVELPLAYADFSQVDYLAG